MHCFKGKAIIFTIFTFLILTIAHVQANNPPGTPSISGPSQGFTGAPVDFLASSDDPDIATSSPAFSSQIRYHWDWESDGVIDKTSDYLDSGEILRETYSFLEEKIYLVRVMAEDSLGATSTWAGFSIDIAKTNDSPILHSIGDKTTGEKQSLSFIVSGEDPDGDELIFSASALPRGAKFSAASSGIGNFFDWTPDDTQSGDYRVTFLIEDGRGGSDSEIITIDVINVDEDAAKDFSPPVISEISSIPSQNSTIVKWSTNEKAIAKVEYGFTDELGNVVDYSGDFARGGEVTIDNLKAGTLYRYKLFLKDLAGNETTIGPRTFVTATQSATAQNEREISLVSGSPIRVKGDPRVYQIIQGKLRHVPSPRAFSTLNLKWEDVIEVEEDEIFSYGRFMLARVAGDSRVYYITEGGLKKWVRNIDIFNSYNNNWEDVRVVSAEELEIFPDVELIKLSGDEKVYKLEGNTKQWIPDIETFNRMGYDWRKVHTVNQTEFEFYETGDVLSIMY